jgi:hypothetical protein
MSGFYETNNLPNFNISKQPVVITPSNLNNYINPVIIYSSFELTSDGEFKINPIIRKPEYGYFLVTQPSTGTEIQFVGNPEVVTKILGTISFNYDYSVESISDTTFQFNLSNLPTPTPFYGTISLQILLKK